jgi:hypothetical protein
MRKLLGLTGAGFLALFLVSTLAGTAGAATVDWAGTFTITIGDFPKDGWLGTGTGVATVNGSGGLGHLNTLQLPGGGVTATGTVPQTDPENATLITLMIDPGQPPILPRGVLAPISGGGPLTLNTLTGVGLGTGNARFKQCILLPGCSGYIPIPLTEGGVTGAGIGGTVTVNTFSQGPGLKLSLVGQPWTLGVASHALVPNRITLSTGGASFNIGPGWTGNNPPVATRFTTSTSRTVQGFVHGPASNTSSTAKLSGVIQVVTPTAVTTSLAPPNNFLPVFGFIRLHFIPEPGLILLLGSGIAGLVVLGRHRMRK